MSHRRLLICVLSTRILFSRATYLHLKVTFTIEHSTEAFSASIFLIIPPEKYSPRTQIENTADCDRNTMRMKNRSTDNNCNYCIKQIEMSPFLSENHLGSLKPLRDVPASVSTLKSTSNGTTIRVAKAVGLLLQRIETTAHPTATPRLKTRAEHSSVVLAADCFSPLSIPTKRQWNGLASVGRWVGHPATNRSSLASLKLSQNRQADLYP